MNTFKISLEVVGEMLYDRGYKLDFNGSTSFDKKIEAIAIRRNKPSHKVLVVWYPNNDNGGEDPRITIQFVASLKERAKEMDKIIIITDTTVTLKASKMIDVEKDNFELHSFKDTLFNPTKHKLVPQHRALTPVEKKCVMNEYDKDLKKYPRILTSDSMCKWYGWKTGTMIEITRGKEITYRIVVTK